MHNRTRESIQYLLAYSEDADGKAALLAHTLVPAMQPGGPVSKDAPMANTKPALSISDWHLIKKLSQLGRWVRLATRYIKLHRFLTMCSCMVFLLFMKL